MPTGRSGVAGAVVGSCLYVFGGEGNPADPNGIFHEVEAYDPATDSWVELPPMQTGRHGIYAAVRGNVIYLPGGATVQGLGTTGVNEAYVIEVPTRPAAAGPHGSACASHAPTPADRLFRKTIEHSALHSGARAPAKAVPSALRLAGRRDAAGRSQSESWSDPCSSSDRGLLGWVPRARFGAPWSVASSPDDAAQSAKPVRALSLTDAIVVIVGIVVGAGIFKTPSLVAAAAGSEAAVLLLWIVGGIVTLIGALCYAELVTAYPHPGGDYHFLQRAYGRPPAFLFAWARMTVLQTGSIALLAFVFGDYASQLFSLGSRSSAIFAAVLIVVLTAINVAGLRQGKATQKVLTTAEIAGLLLVVAAGLFFAQPSRAASGPPKPKPARPASGSPSYSFS